MRRMHEVPQIDRITVPSVAAHILRRLPEWVVAALLFYTFYIGGTWAGVFRPDTAQTSLWMLVAAFCCWLVLRIVRRLPWFLTPLDLALPLWLAAFALSTLANAPSLNRIVIGLWFAGLYIALWYMLQDLLNHSLSVPALLNGLLIGGVPVLITALHQVGRAERIAGSLENPNILGGFLVLLIPLACGRLLADFGSGRLFWRAVLAVYIAAALSALIFSGSRGAWIGVAAAGAFGMSTLMAPRVGLRRLTIIAVPLIAIFFAVLMAERDNTGRIAMYQGALRRLADQPLTGSGLFTFKYYEPWSYNLVRLHVHAHNLPLQIGAELGLPGLTALAASGALLGRAAWGQWRAEAPSIRPLRAGAVIALVGFAAHHMVDFPVMTPAVAIALIATLCIATAPVKPQPIAHLERLLALALLIVLVTALAASGLWTVATAPNTLLRAVNFGIP